MNPNRHAAAVPWTYAAELLTNLNRLDVYVTGTGTGSRSPSVSVTQETVMLMDSVDGRLDLLVLGPGDSEGAHPQTLLESEVGSGSDGDDGTCHRLQPLGNDSFVLSLGLDQGGPEGDHPRGNSLFGGPLRLSDTVAPGKTELGGFARDLRSHWSYCQSVCHLYLSPGLLSNPSIAARPHPGTRNPADPRSFAQGLACRACSLQLAGAPKQLFSQPSRYWQEWAAELWFCHATPGAQMAAESAVAAASNLITPSSGTWLVGPTELCIPVADLVSPPRDVFQRTLRCDRCQAALGSPVLPPDEAEAGAASPAIGFWKHAVRALPAEDLYKSFGVEQFAARSLVAATEVCLIVCRLLTELWCTRRNGMERRFRSQLLGSHSPTTIDNRR